MLLKNEMKGERGERYFRKSLIEATQQDLPKISFYFLGRHLILAPFPPTHLLMQSNLSTDAMLGCAMATLFITSI